MRYTAVQRVTGKELGWAIRVEKGVRNTCVFNTLTLQLVFVQYKNVSGSVNLLHYKFVEKCKILYM